MSMSPDNKRDPSSTVIRNILISLFVIAFILIAYGIVLAFQSKPEWRWTTWYGLAVLTTATLIGWLWGAPVPPPAPGPEGTRVATGPMATVVHAKDGIPLVRLFAEYPEPVFAWLMAYPLFPIQVLLFWAISWLDFGGGLGIPDLVWGNRWWMRLWVGISIALLFGNAFFTRTMLDRRPGSTPPAFFNNKRSLLYCSPSEVIRQVGSFLTWTWLPALVIFYLPVWRNDWIHTDDGYPGMMLLGMVLGVTAAIALITLFERWIRSRYFTNGRIIQWFRKRFWSLPGFRDNAIPDADRPLHSVGLLITGLPLCFFGLLLFEMAFFNAVWSPVWLLCLLLGLFNSLYGLVTFHLSGLQYMLLILGALLLTVSNINNTDKMSLPGMEAYAGKRVPLDEKPNSSSPVALIQTKDLLATFEQKKGKPGTVGKQREKPKLVIVATTGGGIQAAVWTAVVLENLEADPELKQAGFRDHIRLITGASGGMQAAALYTADFENGQKPRTTPLHRQLARDSLWPTAQTMMFNDIPGAFWPKSLTHDRGRSLEAAWEANCHEWKDSSGKVCDPPNWYRQLISNFQVDTHNPLSRTFKDLRETEVTCDRPSLVFSPMLVEDCRRLMISNLDLGWFTTTQSSHLNPPLQKSTFLTQPVADEGTISVPAIEFWRYFPECHDKFKVVTAARMSATFPYVGPAVSLPTNPPRRVVDAGYFDNFGINFTSMWLLHHKEAIREHTSGVVILEIRAYPRREEKIRFATTGKDGKPSPETFNWAQAELSSPLEAIYNLYARSAYFRNDQLLHLLDEEFNKPRQADQPFFTTVTFECSQPAALSWALPQQSYRQLCAIFSDEDVAQLLQDSSCE